MKKLISLLAVGLFLATPSAHAAHSDADCSAKAAEKKLAGAAKNSFVKKCVKDSHAEAAAANGASPACEKSAADKKLAGAAKNSHIKKCMADSAKSAASAPAK